jgi:hypothetical protein
MIEPLDRFLALPPQEKMIYQVGRRLGLFSRIDDLATPNRRRRAEETCERFGITPANADTAIDEIMRRFI